MQNSFFILAMLLFFTNCKNNKNSQIKKINLYDSATINNYIDNLETESFAKFTIDLVNSDFTFESSPDKNTYYYAIKKSSVYSNENGIQISLMPASNNKEYADHLIEEYKKINKYSNIKHSKIIINGVNAYEIVFNVIMNGKTLKGYKVILGNEKATLDFTGFAIDDQDKLLKEFKDISKSILIY